MIGIEVAGLVLGALPILISGLQACVAGTKPILALWHYHEELKVVSLDLRTEESIFRNTIEILLSDCLEQQTVAALLGNPQGPLWKDTAVEDALHRRLQRDFEMYFENVKSMNATMGKFKERLKLGVDGKPPFNADPRSFREAFKRLRFSLERSAYKDLLVDLHKANTTLLSLTQQNAALEPIRMKASGQYFDLDTKHSHAASLFRMLQKGLLNTCGASHSVSLCLTAHEASKPSGQQVSDVFRVVMHHSASAPNQLVWSIKEIEFRPMDLCITGKQQSQSKPAHLAAKGTINVRSSHPITGTSSAGSAAVQSASLTEITNICASIQRLNASHCGECLGYVMDSLDTQYHGLYWPTAPLVERSDVTLHSLASVFAHQKVQSHDALTVAQGRHLALAVSAGMLQIHDTPWLPKQWGRHEIMLPKKSGLLLAGHPFVSISTEKENALKVNSIAPRQYFPSCVAIKNETVFALGRLLIELSMGSSFEELAEPTELSADGTKNALSDIITAEQLLPFVYSKSGDRYGDAVRRCVRCDFDQWKNSLDDDYFKQAVYDGVVSVLEEEARMFSSSLP